MDKRIAISMIAVLTSLWLAQATAQNKFNPPPVSAPPPIIKIKPDPIVPQPKLPPVPLPAAPTPDPAIEPLVPQPKLPPVTSPAPAPMGSPTIEPKVPPATLPVDPTGGRFGQHERDAAEAARDAARAGRLADQESGLDATMGAGPGDDRPGSGTDVDMLGFGKDDGTVMERFCKTKSARLFPGLCPGRGGDLPSDGDLSGFYDTQRPPTSTDPGGSMSFEGTRAGSGVPSRGEQASDDYDWAKDVTTETGPDGSMHDSWTDTQGRRHDSWVSGNGDDALHEVHNPDGSFNYSVQRHQTPMRNGYWTRETTYTAGRHGTEWHTTERCYHNRCRPASQPGESGYGQTKARPWFCARNPKAKGCEPTAPGSQIDPAHPDGEGTPGGPRPTTHRLGSGAVSDPGPADREIRGTTGGGGGGSGPGFDMKDPVNPNDPEGPGRPPARP